MYQSDNRMPRILFFSIGLLSASVIAFQLTLMQLLSIMQWSHFAYMVISVAMLGFGASGTLLAFTRGWFTKHIKTALPSLMIFTSLAMAGLMGATGRLFISFDSFLLFTERNQMYSLLLTYLGFFIPFFSAALAIGLIYIVYVPQVGKLYFADLAGSGMGGLLSLLLFWIFFPAVLPAIIAFFPLLAGLFLLPRKQFQLPLIIAAISLMVIVSQLFYPTNLHSSSFKSISRTLNLPEAKIRYQKASPYGLAQVLSSPALRYAPGLSLSFQHEIPVQDVIFNNGDWFGPVDRWSQNDSLHILDFTTAALPYRIRHPKQVLILEAGTGQSIAHALVHHAKKIVAVEPHKVVLQLLQTELVQETDALLLHKNVQLFSLNPRSFLLADTMRYDLIVLPTLSSFGGSAGIQAMKEQYLYTVEAIQDMFQHLTDDGMIAISTWMDYPARYPLKLTATLRDVCVKNGVDPNLHLLAVRSWGMVTYVLSKPPHTQDEVDLLNQFSVEMYFDPLIAPSIPPEHRMRFNSLQDTTFLTVTDALLQGTGRDVYDDYIFNIKPATDNQPYFSQFIKWNRFAELRKHYGTNSIPYIETGYVLVVFTFIQICLAAFVLILLPLWRLGWKGKYQSFTAWHFSGLGIGFMFVEIILIQKFILFLGHPIYAVAIVLCALLLFSGAGSVFISRISLSHLALSKVAAIIVAVLLLFIMFLHPVLRSLIHLSMPLKMLISLLLIAPLAFFMGMPFPMGLKLLSTQNQRLIPWAWGINGCWSVISTALATIIAVETGFGGVMALAVLAYAVVGLANFLQQKKSHAV